MKDLDNLILLNEKEKSKWMNERMSKGYSFRYEKGNIDGYDYPINIGVECMETGEFLRFDWVEIDDLL